jgi:hypothetical protein
MSETTARRLTDDIKTKFVTITKDLETIKLLIERAEQSEVWRSLGYASWTAYVTEEFSGFASGLERALRSRVVEVLGDAGLSTRAIAPVVGVSHETVRSDLAGVKKPDTSTTAKIIGLDGRRYERPQSAPPTPPAAPRRRPLPPRYRDAVWDLRRAVEKLERLTAEENFVRNAEELALYGDLLDELRSRLHDNVLMPLIKGATKR